MTDTILSFIELQFPVSRVSKESYKERKAGNSQTLTGLGKWWGRKPLILVRAALLGLLMPAGTDPEKDREIFLKILSMDDTGLWKRKHKALPIQVVYENLTPGERKKYFENSVQNKKTVLKQAITKQEKQELQKIAFFKLSYDEKLAYCIRPEEIEITDQSQWEIINEHLGTHASNLQELIQELGKKRFGHIPVVGDCFCGGGSVPFEAARMGCEIYASDLNPIAMLLTWACVNINGSDNGKVEQFKAFQEKIFHLADQQIKEWKTEINEKGWRAESYLYCNETICPECGYRVPLAPSWVIGTGAESVALLKKNISQGFDIAIKSWAEKEEIKQAQESATIQKGGLVCSNCKMLTPVTALRKDKKNEQGTVEYGLRKWDLSDFVPDPGDVFQERLYCIRYEEEYKDKNGKIQVRRHNTAPDNEDLEREKKVITILQERLGRWQEKGYIPIIRIEQGYNTSQIIRERGWKYWRHLFNPRQLLIIGLLMELIDKEAKTKEQKVIGLLGVNKCCNWNSKLSQWMSYRKTGGGAQTFSNQALNTLFNYNTRTVRSLETSWFFNIHNYPVKIKNTLEARDARNIDKKSDIWITDPPYADAINYHELSEFFLAWDKKMLTEIFPEWQADSRRALAVRGKGESFNNSMIEIYRNMADHMPDNGMQVVMFTHQDVRIWAELTIILWSAGLQVTGAWNIATETEASGLKQGNYIKGTVLLVLRKQYSDETAYLDELYPEVEEEVRNQIESMRDIDDTDEPNFSDADYLLAAYAASLKILTSYRKIEDIDVSYELSKTRNNKEVSPVEQIIGEAVKIAHDCLIPKGFDSFMWKTLVPEERFYIKGLDLEKNGVSKIGAYQELARGFGVREYKEMLANSRANQARLKTATEYAMKGLSDKNRFGSSLVRNVLAALCQTITKEDTAKGRHWLQNEAQDYWRQRNTIIEILDYISTFEHIENMRHWRQESKFAKMLRELIKNDGV
ncbi:MAG: DUF1156 domain-containing protein [Desulfobacteraceae bacterium]|nr:DUF1156 domain-containing protein [Desulfobacteraceae bacterium]